MEILSVVYGVTRITHMDGEPYPKPHGVNYMYDNFAHALEAAGNLSFDSERTVVVTKDMLYKPCENSVVLRTIKPIACLSFGLYRPCRHCSFIDSCQE